jgi:hypothetical protein
MKTQATEEKKTGVSRIEQEQMLEMQDGVMQAAMAVLTLAVALVGVWGLLSLFGGIALGGGIGEIIRGWYGAVGGM